MLRFIAVPYVWNRMFNFERAYRAEICFLNTNDAFFIFEKKKYCSPQFMNIGSNRSSIIMESYFIFNMLMKYMHVYYLYISNICKTNGGVYLCVTSWLYMATLNSKKEYRYSSPAPLKCRWLCVVYVWCIGWIRFYGASVSFITTINTLRFEVARSRVKAIKKHARLYVYIY